MPIYLRNLVVTLIFCALFCPRFSAAQTIWVTGGHVGQQTGIIGTMTPAGVFTQVGVTDTQLSGIAFSPSGVLYGISTDATTLFTINANTGALTTIGATGLDAGQSDGLAFRADGALFLANQVSSLYTLDTGTGAASLVGAIGNASVGTIAFDDGGHLFQTNDDPANGASDLDVLDTLDQTTGAGTAVGEPGANTAFTGIFGLAFSNGALFGFDDSNHVIRLDTVTGFGTQVGVYQLPDSQIVLAATAASTVPEPSAAALLSGFMASGAAFLWRRKQSRQII